jgi:hypothetical protein
VDEPQACKEQQKKLFRDDYQCANDLLRKLGSVFEFPQYYRNLTSAAADFAEEPEKARRETDGRW